MKYLFWFLECKCDALAPDPYINLLWITGNPGVNNGLSFKDEG